MKPFRVIQKKFSLLGIVPKQSKRSRLKLVKTCLIYGLFTISNISFLVFDVNTFTEYVNNIYVTSTVIMITSQFTILVIKNDQVFKLIIDCENLIDESEC